jgi:hypothetical protein
MILSILLLLTAFLIAHESGHVICALILRLKIDKIGITLKPYPHPFVAVSEIRSNFQYFLFLFSGFLVTLILFTVFWCSGYLYIKSLYIAITVEMLLETNPFHSDFTIAFNTSKRYSGKWYIHFTLWFFLMYMFYNPKLLYGYFLP